VVGEACDGAQAVRMAVEHSPDVVLMDLEMPGMDGYEATRRIKSQAHGVRAHEVRVIILSVHAGPEERQRALAAGADGFVMKGADYQVLLDAILPKEGSSNSIDPG
jgi:DNA-binding NarL/FixJ family response regulator